MNDKIVILGGGPSGLLLARLLAEHSGSTEIHVYERAQALEKRINEKSYSFAIFERGFKALAVVPGLDERVRERSAIIKRRALNTLPENMRHMKVANPFALCQRDELVAALIQSLQDLGDPRVHLHFGENCTKVDFANREVHFSQDDGPATVVGYDLLFGADGANSVVRRTLESEHGYACENKPYFVAYRNLYLDHKAVDALNMGPDQFQGWALPGNKMLGAVPQPDGTAACNFLFPMNDDADTSAQAHWNELEDICPELVALVGETERNAFLERPILTTRTIKMDCYHFEDHVCLLGDAAHAVPPSIGQGCNSAMEDSAILDGLLEQFGQDRAGALAAFTKERVPEMHALLTLSVMAGQTNAKVPPKHDKDKPGSAPADSDAPKKPPFNMVEYLSTSQKSFSQVLKEQRDGLLQA